MAWSRFRKKKDMPEGLWVKCRSCNQTLYTKELLANLQVCHHCGFHAHQSARERAITLVDPRSFIEMWDDLYTQDLLDFVDKEPYPEKIRKTATRSGLTEGAVAGTGTIDGKPVTICCLDFSFMGGSMGAVVGEKVTRAIELAADERIPAIVVSCSGGARMHEGMLSLMQMGKTSAAIARLNREKGLYLSVLANPTTGGVMASFAALGDVIFAEPGALIGFAGPRVIQETLRTELPEGFQTAEFLREKGFIDRIVLRKDLRAEIGKVIDFLWAYPEEQIERYAPPPPPPEEEGPEGDDGVGENAESLATTAADGEDATPAESDEKAE
ncbi:MAG: acetyl-CoA carboxylase carboxyl transferase subunit beta [Planctomycetes bacterium]|nr:acetyl-CoA carboxylase carboxyl transferase subunit beta [Planctomycetota bacterium]